MRGLFADVCLCRPCSTNPIAFLSNTDVELAEHCLQIRTIYFSEVESRPVYARNVIVPMSFFSHQVQQKIIVPFILIADPCYGRSL